MSSYAQDVKNELARIFGDEPETLHAEFAALLSCGAKIFDGRLEFTTTNAAVVSELIVNAPSVACKIFCHAEPLKLETATRFVTSGLSLLSEESKPIEVCV